MGGLDLSGLAQFRASALLVASASTSGSPLEVEVGLIDFDPLQPRRSLDVQALAGLAASIKVHGVLEPVSLRTHPESPGRYLVNRGERRVRASLMAGRQTVPAWLDERVDRYAQAIENLQREDLSPFDLARFISEREREGDSRALIAARLHKPASFITEVAGLIDAPPQVREAYDSGRARDTRVLYRLVCAMRKGSATVGPLLEEAGPITRLRLAPARAPKAQGQSPDQAPDQPPATGAAQGRVVKGTKTADALLVEHGGRRGRLGLSGWPGRRTGEVRFDDGSRQVFELAELRLIAWTAR